MNDIKKDSHFLISRTDNIGDVVLTLPLCGFIKEKMPNAKITFLGKTYTKDIVNASKHIDNFIDYSMLEQESDENLIALFSELELDYFVHVFPNKRLAKIAKKAQIPNRIGTLNRHYHWLNCNMLPKVSRNKSDLHESQLNIQLLRPVFGNDVIVNLTHIAKLYGYEKLKASSSLFDKSKFNLILHPLSFGSAKDWPLESYKDLIDKIDLEKFKVFVTGTEKESIAMNEVLLGPCKGLITDVTGKFTLEEFIEFISQCDGLIAASTGPLHIASAMGLNALGLFAPNRPIHPERWKAVGIKANTLVEDSENSVKFLNISTDRVLNHLNSWR